MPTRTTHRPRKRANQQQRSQSQTPPTRPASQRMGWQVSVLGLVLLVPVLAQLLTLGGAVPLLGLLTGLNILFLATVVGCGVQQWRQAAPSGRLASVLSGSSALWLGVFGGMLISAAGLFPSWQAGYAQEYATSILPVLFGVPLVLLVGGWASQAIDAAGRIRRALVAYSSVAALVSVLLLLLSSAPVLLLGVGIHLLALGWSWRLRAIAEQARDQGLETGW